MCGLPARPLTSFPPAKSARRVELECRQIWCSPGVCEVKVKRPSEPYCRERITCGAEGVSAAGPLPHPATQPGQGPPHLGVRVPDLHEHA